MILHSPCKINIGLEVHSKRDDGYHNIETLFYKIDNLYDIIEILKSDNLEFSSSGIPIDCPPEHNLCLKAFNLLKAKYPQQIETNIFIHLHKSIPMGAGLAGGSSNAVTILKGCNTIFNLNLSKEELFSLALTIGSDCPFFLEESLSQTTPVARIGSSRGELFTEFNIDLSSYHILLFKPSFSISTSDAYNKIKKHIPITSLKERLLLGIENWKDSIYNDFETVINNAQLPLIKEVLYKTGAIYSSLTGSGSVIYAIFPKENKQVKDITVSKLYSFKGSCFWV